MSRTRLILAHLVITAVIAGSLYDIGTDQEHWPFSQYPMFSDVWRAREFTWLRLYGVALDGHEVPLDHRKYIEPFDESRLPKALRQISRQPDAENRLRQALADCFARYHELRRRKEHHGEMLRGLRLYQVRWLLDAEARNVDAPEARTLMVEYFHNGYRTTLNDDGPTH